MSRRLLPAAPIPEERFIAETNLLPELIAEGYSADPRVVTALVAGLLATCGVDCVFYAALCGDMEVGRALCQRYFAQAVPVLTSLGEAQRSLT